MKPFEERESNLGRVDRIIRVVLGAFVVSLLYWGPQSLWALFGMMPLITGITGFSPLYRRMGWSTLKRSPPAGPAHGAKGA